MKCKSDLNFLFQPRSIAIIGASKNSTKIGHKIVKNILFGGYHGKIFPVNPKAGKILGLRVYADILEIPDEIDLVCMAIPAQNVFDEIKKACVKKVKYCLIISSGFSEIGKVKLEKKITDYALEKGMRILGPNIFGLYSSQAKMNATFGPRKIKPGNVSIITQSGALGIALMGKTQTEGIGLANIISVGNKADITEAEILIHLAENDKKTKVIFIYIEGLKNGRKFIKALASATRKKPVIILKSGYSKKGAQAAASHTGSLAGESKVFSDIMKQFGTIRATTLDEAISRIKFFSKSPLPQGQNAVIITNGGGIGVLATDACERHKVNLFDDLKVLKNVSAGVIPEFGSYKNPIDITGQAGISDYKKILTAALAEEKINAIICLGCETAVLETDELANLIEQTFKTSRKLKPLVFAFVGGEKIAQCLRNLNKKEIPFFGDVDQAVSCLGAAYFNYRFLQKPKGPAERLKINLNKISRLLKKIKQENRRVFLSEEKTTLMSIAGISVPQSLITASSKEAGRMAEKIGFPVVMKIISQDILHKKDIGGVILDIGNKKMAERAYAQILNSCRRALPTAKIAGIEVSEMAKEGFQAILGARNDSVFGPIVVFGTGGTYVEIINDVKFRALPLNRHEAMLMIKDTVAYSILRGIRGDKEKDINAVIDTLLKIGEILLNFKEIEDIEINPLLINDKGKGVKALDIRVILKKN